jgi:hypothetical protein
MVNPVPGYNISTPYGKRGSYWSCDRDQYGNGIHTGADFAAPSGTKAVAARPGTVKHVNHGSAFGNHQIEVVASDGSADFYAHLRSRVASGTKVEAGGKVGEVGAEGNVTGPHLHFEKHKAGHTGWSCSAAVNPQPSIDYQPSSGSGGSGAGTGGGGSDKDMPTRGKARTNKAVKLKANEWTPITWGHVMNNKSMFNEGEYGILITNKMFTASLSAKVTGRNGGTVRTSWVEVDNKTNAASDTYDTMTHGAVDSVVDTRAGFCNDGQKLRARIQCTTDATLESATIELLTW